MAADLLAMMLPFIVMPLLLIVIAVNVKREFYIFQLLFVFLAIFFAFKAVNIGYNMMNEFDYVEIGNATTTSIIRANVLVNNTTIVQSMEETIVLYSRMIYGLLAWLIVSSIIMIIRVGFGKRNKKKPAED